MNIQEAKTEIIHTFRVYMKQGPDGTRRCGSLCKISYTV